MLQYPHHPTRKEHRLHRWKAKVDKSFQKPEAVIKFSAIPVFSDFETKFREHEDAPYLTVGGTVTYLENSGNNNVIVYFPKNF